MRRRGGLPRVFENVNKRNGKISVVFDAAGLPANNFQGNARTLRAGPWEVEGFTLYESRLRPEGAAYAALVDYEF